MHKKILDEAIDDFHEAILEVVKSTILITCIAYLRTGCKECVYRHLSTRFRKELLSEWPPERAADDVAQFFRQIVIWTKDSTEALMKEPCPSGDDDDEHDHALH